MNKSDIKIRRKTLSPTGSSHYLGPFRTLDFVYHTKFPGHMARILVLRHQLCRHTPFVRSESAIGASELGSSLPAAPFFEPHIKQT